MPLVLGSAVSGVALGQSTAVGEEATPVELSPVVVTTTRNQGIEGQTPQKVTIIDREQIEQQLAITSDRGQVLGNLIPGYSPSRQKLTNSGESFRGRSPLFLVDGVPQSNPLRDSSRDSYTIDLSMVERIEVIHGASAEHGLGATGGIINFIPRRAESGPVNQRVAASITADDDFESEGFGHKLNYQISGQQGDWDYLAAATRQERGVFYDGDDDLVGISNQGEIQNSRSYDLLAKAGYWIDDNQNIEFSANHFYLENEHDYEPVTGDRDAGIPTGARKGDPDGDPAYNESTALRMSYGHADWFGNALDAQIYHQRFRGQFIAGPYFPYTDDAGNTRFDQSRNESDKLGGKFTLTRGGLLDDRLNLTTGIDVLQDKTRQMLSQTGRTYVPETEFRDYAVFLQGDFSLTDDLTLHSGVRHEEAELNVDTYQTIDRSDVNRDNVTVEGGNPDFGETLFNAGLVYQATDWAQLFANYSEGFGMPDVGRVLRGIGEPGQGVDELLQLEPILTDNREIGTRLAWDDYRFELSYFESDSDYGQRFEANADGIYEIRREKTKIQGVVLSGDIRLNDRHGLDVSYAHTEGKSDTDGDGTVDTKLSGANIAADRIRLGWSARWSDRLTSYLQVSHFLGRSFDDPELDFDGYTLVGASVGYRLPVGQLSLGIENLLDEDYFTYHSQAGRASDDYYFKGRGRTLTLGYEVSF